MNNIASKLREYRKEMGISVNEVSTFLKSQGYEIEARSVYGYENGSRMPNADVFLSLCVLYKCTDILFEFGYNSKKMQSISISSEEQEILDKYNDLPNPAKDMIRGALGLEKINLCNEKSEVAKMA